MSIFETARGIRDGAVTAAQVMERFIIRLNSINSSLNAVVVFDENRARLLAEKADAVPQGVRGPFHGAPITIKEQYDVLGLPTTLGIPDMKNYIAQKNDGITDRLESLGFLIAGKTNVPIALLDHQTSNPIYGHTISPIDGNLTPGGSSGGSAAALAAGITDLEIGSDIGGSLRIPAHFCGICSHKPTYGLVTTRIFGDPKVVDMATPGPMARDIETLEAVFPQLVADEGMYRPDIELEQSDKSALSEFKVAVWADDVASSIGSEYAAVINTFVEKLSAAGTTVDCKARPDHDCVKAAAVGHRLMWAASSAAMPPSEIEHFRDSSDRFSEDDWRIEACRAVGLGVSHHEWHRLDQARAATCVSWNSFLNDFDLIVMPIHIDAAFTHDLDRPLEDRTITVDGEERKQMDCFFWVMQAHPEGLPATTLPIGKLSDGRPVAVQIVARSYADMKALNFARLAQNLLA